jgi:hypothetical protein
MARRKHYAAALTNPTAGPLAASSLAAAVITCRRITSRWRGPRAAWPLRPWPRPAGGATPASPSYSPAVTIWTMMAATKRWAAACSRAVAVRILHSRCGLLLVFRGDPSRSLWARCQWTMDRCSDNSNSSMKRRWSAIQTLPDTLYPTPQRHHLSTWLNPPHRDVVYRVKNHNDF